MKIIEKIKYVAAPLVAAAYFTFAPAVQAEEPVEPKAEPTPIVKKETKHSLDIWAENFSVEDTDGSDAHTQRIEVINNGNDRFLRADHTITDDGFEKWRVGLRPKYEIGDLVSGIIGAFGSTDNNGDYSIGAEFTAKIADIIRLGLELEKIHLSGVDSRLFRGHASVEPFKDLTLQLGGYQKDRVGHLQLVGYQVLDGPNLVFGVGLDLAEGLTGKLNACFANYSDKKGKGVGFRVLGHTDLKGETYGLDLMLRIGDNKGKKSHCFLMDIFDGINDPTTKEKVTRYRAPPNYARASRVLAKFNTLHLANGTDRFIGELYGRTSDLLGKNINLVVGGKWMGTKIPGQNMEHMFEALLGGQFGPFTVEYYLDFGKGMKPVHMIYVGTSANDLIQLFAPDKKK